MKILFTGFEPFGGEAVNPSWEAVRMLPDTIDGAEIVRLRLPVSYNRVEALLRGAIEKEEPDAVICVGQAGGRAMLTPERVAINLMDSTSPDNDGAAYTDAPICADGPAAYFSTLPLRKMVAAMQNAGVPAAISNTAGTYVCNATMYHLLRMLEREFPGGVGGFVHIPYACAQAAGKPAGTPSLPLETMSRGLFEAARVIARENA